MKKRYIVLALTVGAVALFIVMRYSSINNSTSESTEINTLEVTPNISTSLVATKEPQLVADCKTVEKTLRLAANSFMEKHQKRDVNGVLNSITYPTTMEEISEYEFLLGKDLDDEIRLYKTAQFAYETTSYKLEQLSSAGTHQTERGALACDLSIREERSKNTNEEESLFIEETIIRHLIFSVSDSNRVEITDYTTEIGAGKYSGFN